MRRTLPSFPAVTLVCLLTACGGDTGTTDTASTTVTPSADASTAAAPAAIAPSATPTTAAPAAPAPAQTLTAEPKPPAAPALTCKQLAGAHVGSAKVPYNGYPDYLPLTEGRWSGEDGATVLLQKPCGIGDLDGDGAADAVGVVALNGGGSGTFFTVLVWRNSGGKPAFRALADLGDRTPVLSVQVAGQQARVVWLTRSDGRSMAELDIRRTSTYQLSGTTLAEVGHTDAPYTP
ncbi:hypothetical protein GA0074696_1046 [Micromonospora purpureochromogenes]|uniref:Lipoprotein n=1 Tax=Micromonospora purpureochromogenes TaxID=47872 RepID=A0A1C4VDT5_9ACTN|nr:hypothetical protein [Micromonospora purpureochromogenes]SCE81889.1 hypothetical protein GA0074696_1046 [Micromonospora purpureochromogenes]